MGVYTNIKSKIKEKLEGIGGIKIVHSYEKLDLGGFPAVVILGFTINDILEDTKTNLREYTFKVRVFQELVTTNPEKAEEIIDNLIDTLMDAFGQDFTLGGACEGCWVRSSLGWVDREVGMRCYDIEILVKKLITI